MWECSTCGESLEDQFDSCWRCAGASGEFGSEQQVILDIASSPRMFSVTWWQRTVRAISVLCAIVAWLLMAAGVRLALNNTKGQVLDLGVIDASETFTLLWILPSVVLASGGLMYLSHRGQGSLAKWAYRACVALVLIMWISNMYDFIFHPTTGRDMFLADPKGAVSAETALIILS